MRKLFWAVCLVLVCGACTVAEYPVYLEAEERPCSLEPRQATEDELFELCEAQADCGGPLGTANGCGDVREACRAAYRNRIYETNDCEVKAAEDKNDAWITCNDMWDVFAETWDVPEWIYE